MNKSTPLARYGMPAKLRQDDQKQMDGAQAQRDEEWQNAKNYAKSQHPDDYNAQMQLTQFLSGNTRR